MKTQYFTGRKVYRTRNMRLEAFDSGENMQGEVVETKTMASGLWVRVAWNDGTAQWLTGSRLPYAPTA